MLQSPWIAALIALFVWWFSTGAILWVVRRTEGESGKRATLGALPLLIAGALGFWASLDRVDFGGVYMGFAAALAIWGWIELAFLTGLITGPNAYPCPPDAPLWERFVRAWGTIAYHEMLLVFVLITLMLLSWQAPNTVGVASFGVLFVARITAKLNLFFGVPKFNTEFLPHHLAHLPSHFRIARMNWFFPISVTALSCAVAYLVAQAGHAQTPALASAQVLLATLTALARGLRPGGLLLLEPWVTPDRFRDQEPHMATFETQYLKVCRQCVLQRQEDCSILEFHWLVARPGFPVEHLVERNELWLYETDTLQRALQEAGFSVRQTDQGFMEDKTLLVCLRVS